MPSTLVGLLAVLLAATPGYLYLFGYERRTPREALSPGREVAEMVAAGASSTLAAALGVFALAEVWSALLTLEQLTAGRRALVEHPWAALATGALVLGISAALCAGLGHVLGGRTAYATGNRARPGTVWHGVLTSPCYGRDEHGARVETRRFVAVHLQDGLRVEGYFERVSRDTDTGMRDIALSRPIALTPKDGERRASAAATVIVPGALIRLIETGPPPTAGPG
ncbi:hypothetical protein QF035_004697 [Streptomyces umbrinus]|uniref:Integral membrane protein n=1 Tax=Streptomyces umbrinus TaxID=67370 RepID=A0ABU0SUA6_9ACTN|nr:DUF6338 family protein [Streptomyces umbrinus]MDQ1027115.1 hypothetical protein [Streptomyces umbrinus]